MKKVILVSLPSCANYDIFIKDDTPPLALYVLANSIISCNMEPIIYDPNYFAGHSAYKLHKEFVDEISKHIDNVFAIGFSANTFNWAITVKVVKYLKKMFPNIPIILGGLHPTRFPNYALKATNADYVLIGEGEISLAQLLTAIRDNLDINISGLVSKGKVINDYTYSLLPLEQFKLLPPPAYSYLPSGSYVALPLESSRGCLHSCAFCSIPHRKNWRGLDVSTLLNRVEYAKKFIHKVKNRSMINFTDDCFTQDVQRAKDVINALYELKDGFSYFIEARVSNLLTDNLVECFPVDIVSNMQIGVECGYDEGLRLVKKGTTIARVVDCLERLKQTGLNTKVFLSFIIGFPWENEEDINKTIDFVAEISSKYQVRCSVNWLIFLPSDLWEQRKIYSINIDESFYENFQWERNRENFYICHPKITEDIYERIAKKIFLIQSQNSFIEYHHTAFYDYDFDSQFKKFEDD